MTINVVGNHPICQRIETNLYSLDRAFTNHLGSIGIPIGVGYEIFGSTGIGKSTFSYSLAGIIARTLKSNILLCDFEGFDTDFLTRVLSTVEFSGEVLVQSDKEDEKQLMLTLDTLSDKKSNSHVALLDSISAITPVAEQEGDIGAANMGKRASAMAQFTRRSLHIFRFASIPKTIIAINHWRPKIGSMGYEAPGGVVKNYLFTVRILLKRVEESADGSYLLEGTVVKNRWGFSDRVFSVFMLGGYGLHAGLTAVCDCIATKQATEKNKVVFIDTEKIGRFSALVKAAKAGEEEVFKPFMERLNGTKSVGSYEERDESGELDEVQD